MRYIIIGDTHGNYTGVRRILDKSKYDPSTDNLIFVGDYCDHFPYTGGNVKTLIGDLIELQTIASNVYCITGNHDTWFRDWLNNTNESSWYHWMNMGGIQTLSDYMNIPACLIPRGITIHQMKNHIPDTHITFFNSLRTVYVDDQIVVVHGGFKTKDDMISVNNGLLTHNVLWNRTFYNTTDKELLQYYKEIFGSRIFVCGHTPSYDPVVSTDPLRILIDCGHTNKDDLQAVIIAEDNTYSFISEC